MDLGIGGRRALVTGSSRGLGKAVALWLAREGAKVALVARDKEKLDTIVTEMGGPSNGHCGIALDLMQDGAIESLKTALHERFGSPDIIVHNLGGTLGVRDYLAPARDFQEVFRFNVGIATDLNRLYIPEMAGRQWGRVVHISSSAAVTIDSSLGYATAKAALNVYAKGLARRVAKDGVVVTTVMPGPFRHPGNLWDTATKEQPDWFKKFVELRLGIGRVGEVDEVAAMVVFLCSQFASFCCASIVPVDGGMS